MEMCHERNGSLLGEVMWLSTSCRDPICYLGPKLEPVQQEMPWELCWWVPDFSLLHQCLEVICILETIGKACYCVRYMILWAWFDYLDLCAISHPSRLGNPLIISFCLSSAKWGWQTKTDVNGDDAKTAKWGWWGLPSINAKRNKPDMRWKAPNA